MNNSKLTPSPGSAKSIAVGEVKYLYVIGINFEQGRKDLARANQIANALQGLLDKGGALTDSARAAASSAKESQVITIL